MLTANQNGETSTWIPREAMSARIWTNPSTAATSELMKSNLRTGVSLRAMPRYSRRVRWYRRLILPPAGTARSSRVSTAYASRASRSNSRRTSSMVTSPT